MGSHHTQASRVKGERRRTPPQEGRGIYSTYLCLFLCLCLCLNLPPWRKRGIKYSRSACIFIWFFLLCIVTKEEAGCGHSSKCNVTPVPVWAATSVAIIIFIVRTNFIIMVIMTLDTWHMWRTSLMWRDVTHAIWQKVGKWGLPEKSIKIVDQRRRNQVCRSLQSKVVACNGFFLNFALCKSFEHVRGPVP